MGASPAVAVGGGSGTNKNGVVWGGFIFELDGSVGSVVAHIIGFYFSVPIFCFR